MLWFLIPESVRRSLIIDLPLYSAYLLYLVVVNADVVVVGAGLAGLAAARRLVASGWSVAVLEARDRTGGRVLNQDIGDGKIVEMGGKWVGPGQHHILSMIQELKLETFPTYTLGDSLWVTDGKVSRYHGSIPKLNPAGLIDFAVGQFRFDQMARTVPIEAPWLAVKAPRWDSRTFESWIRSNVRTATAQHLFRIYCSAVFATETSDLSLLHALFYTHAGGGVDSLVNVKGGAQQDRIVGGSQLIAQRMAEELGDAIHLDCPVRKIQQDAPGVCVVSDRLTVRAQSVIVAIPPTLAGRIIYEPMITAYRDQLTQRVPQGSVIKCYAIYDRPFWREEGLTGNAVSDQGPIKFTYDISPPDGLPGVLVGYFEGAAARFYGQRPVEERKAAAVACFARYFGQKATEVRDYIDKDWSAEEWTRGCYSGHFPPGVWTAYGPALREPCGRIHWAGTETATEWNGYMDGAISSGYRAAAEVLAR